MRIISGPALAQLNASSLKMAVLVEMMMSAPVRLNTANVNLTYGGNTYFGTGILGGIGESEDSPGEYKNLTFSLSGVDVAVISIALQENIRNKVVTVRLAVIHPDTFEVLDAPIEWTGTMDQMPVSQDKKSDTGSVNVTAEHRGLTMSRPKPINYTEVDQLAIDPSDTSLRFIQSQSTHQDVWPAASFGRQ